MDERLTNLFNLIGFFQVPDKDIIIYTAKIEKDPKIKKVPEMKDVLEYLPTPMQTLDRRTKIFDAIKPLPHTIYRQAETPTDFEIIYQRELKKANYPEGVTLLQNLSDRVTEMREYECSLPAKQRDGQLQDLAYKFLQWVERLQEDGTVKLKEKTKSKKLTAPAIALFCRAISETKIIVKPAAESAESYCKRVCKSYELPYTVRVRQNFYNQATAKNIRAIITNVFPKIPQNIHNALSTYLKGNAQIFG